MFEEINNLEEFNNIIASEDAILAYFSTNECNVCKTLKPKVNELLTWKFPKIRKVYINLNNSPEVGAQNRVFTVPTILIFFEGREFLRKSRSFGIAELENEISRPYKIMFG